jgi:hypothetical protein
MTVMKRRRSALLALLAFVVLTLISVVVSGSRPQLQQGDAPWVLQVLGYLGAVAAGVLLLMPDAGGVPTDRRAGLIVLGGVVVLAVVEAWTLATDSGGADIGAGGVRLVALIALAVVTVRLAAGTFSAGHRAS